jgi:2'-5' RNA ligase
MKRLFFALWPDDETRSQIDHLNQSIGLSGLKKVNRNNLHATLVFLGQVDDKSEATFRLGAEKIKVEPFQLVFDQLVFWKKPKILCLTANQHHPQLLALVNALKNLADQSNIKTEERPYQAHITLARKATHAIKIKIEPVEWQAQSFCLVESCSTPNGVIYKVLHRWCYSA